MKNNGATGPLPLFLVSKVLQPFVHKVFNKTDLRTERRAITSAGFAEAFLKLINDSFGMFKRLKNKKNT